ARLSETDAGDNPPVTIELHDSGVLTIVVRTTNADVVVAGSVRCNREHAARRRRVLRADPLTFERAVFVEQLESRGLPIGDQHVGAAGMKVSELFPIPVEDGDAAV